MSQISRFCYDDVFRFVCANEFTCRSLSEVVFCCNFPDETVERKCESMYSIYM